MQGDSLKEKLYKLIKNKGYVVTFELEEMTRELGYKISNGERRLRELRNQGLIERKYENGVVIGYSVADRRHEPRKTTEFDDLNSQLKEVLKKIKLGFDTYKIVDDIQRAIKAKYPETKQAVLAQYRDRF